MIEPLLFLYIYALHKTQNASKARVYFSAANAAFLSLIATTALVTNPAIQDPHYLLRQPEQVWLSDYIAAFFATDLFLGHLDGGLNMVTGYIHHSVYIGLALYIKSQQQSNLIFLCLPFEIPTLILDLHKLYPTFNYKPAFGSTFLLFRLAMNAYMIEHVSYLGPTYRNISIAMLLTHIAWFIQWSLKIAAQHRGNEE